MPTFYSLSVIPNSLYIFFSIHFHSFNILSSFSSFLSFLFVSKQNIKRKLWVDLVVKMCDNGNFKGHSLRSGCMPHNFGLNRDKIWCILSSLSSIYFFCLYFLVHIFSSLVHLLEINLKVVLFLKSQKKIISQLTPFLAFEIT